MDKRQRLVKSIIGLGIECKLVFRLLGYGSSLNIVHNDDFEWCIEELLACISEPAEPVWAKLVSVLFTRTEVSSGRLDKLISARAKSPKLERETKFIFTPIRMVSEVAKRMKEEYEEAQKFQKKKEPKILEWLPKDRIQFFLDKFEKREHDAWWLLLRNLTLEDTSETYEHIFEPDIMVLPGWRKSDANIRKRILDSAETYVRNKNEFNSDRLLDGAADEKDIAGYKAFLLLMKERTVVLKNLPCDVWVYWIPLLFGPFGSNDNRDNQKLLISIAYVNVPSAVTEHLAQLIRHQIAKEDKYLTVLELVDDVWDQRISDTIYGLLEEAQAKPVCWARMLTVLLKRGDVRAYETAKNNLKLPLSDIALERQKALQSALVLIRATEDAEWSLIWYIIQQETDFGCELIKEVAYGLHHDPSTFVSKLNENSVADLFIWLVEQFPYEKDPQHRGVYSPNKDDAVRELRNRLINILEKAGTPDSYQALQHIASELSGLDWIKSVLVEAKQNTLRSTWQPLQPKEFMEITLQPETVLIRDAKELQELLVEALYDLQNLLQSEYAAPDLWDHYCPKDENHFSDWIKRNLEPKVKSRGIVVAREVQIRRGEKTDIHVTAVIPGLTRGTFEQVRVIIEVKGCWHSQLKKAMKRQLVGRYMKDSECDHGIYLVGWYMCDQWDKNDGRKKQTPEWSLQKAREFFESQAEELSNSGITIRAVVINTSLR
jgi:hypothetical protein